MPSNKKPILLISLIILALGLAGVAYWYFLFKAEPITQNPDQNSVGGFQPFGNAPTSNQDNSTNVEPTVNASSTSSSAPIPKLRLLSNSPVGGYGASTTANSSVVRWIDRGRGNVYEASNESLTIKAISNTIIPKTLSSIWNKNLTAFINSLIENDLTITTVYTEIKPQKISADQLSENSENNQTPFELKGSKLPKNITAYAVSPNKDRIIMIIKEGDTSVGYISTFSGASVTKIFDTPATQLNVEWPENDTIAITTKASASIGGFLYFVNPKTGVWKKILGPIAGLSTKVSRDAKYVAASFTGKPDSLPISIYNVATGKVIESPLNTLAEKCVWGKFYKDILYCGSPNQKDSATYPDDWYKGKVSFSDSLWQMNVSTEEISQLYSLQKNADRPIDAINLQLDDNDDYLYFMNKSDLSLWSLDLVSNN